MKKRTNLIMMLPLLAILNACGIIQADWYDTFVLSNDTEGTIRIIAYHTDYYAGDFFNVQIDTVLAPGATYKATQYNGEDGYLEDPARIILSDSIRIILNDSCFADYWTCRSDTPVCMEIKNPYKPLDYYDEDCPRKGGCDYVYPIVEEDFECSQAPE